MAAGTARAILKDLTDRRTVMETEMNGIIARLTAPGMPGIKGLLVDSDGFPLPNVDLHAIRTDRHRLAVLKTDHAELSANLEKALRSAFAEMQGSAGQHVSTPPVSTSEPKRPRLDEPVEHMDSEPSAPPPPQQPPAGLPRPAAAETPIGVIDEVAARSPADTAGLRVGDVIFQLGGVSSSGDAAETLQRIAQCVSSSVNTPISVIVDRHGVREFLVLTPRSWDGRGLLGCHIAPPTA